MNNKTNCNYFIDCGGLKLLFPILMQKALKDGGEEETTSVRNQSVSILLNLLLFSKSEFKDRLVPKFEENEYEKLKKLAEIYQNIKAAVEKIDKYQATILKELDIDDPEEAQTELMSLKFDKGYLTLLSVSFILKIIPSLWPEVLKVDVVGAFL